MRRHQTGMCGRCGCNSCKCPAGPTGPRGPQGLQGVTGPQGPGVGGYLKWSGDAGFSISEPVESFLADTGIGPLVPTFNSLAMRYPIPIVRSLQNFATNLFTVLDSDSSATVLIELVKNVTGPGLPVVLASTTYVPGEGLLTGEIKQAPFGPVALAVGETLDVRVTTSGFAQGATRPSISATVGTL